MEPEKHVVLNIKVKVTISLWDAFKLRLAGLTGTLEELQSGKIDKTLSKSHKVDLTSSKGRRK